MHKLVDKSQLEAFAQDPKIRRLLPSLVKRLIQSTAGKGGYENLRIPEEENYEITGLDGEVELLEDCRDIPSGKVVIEIGATSEKKTFIKKADAEFKRVKEKLADQVSDYTFLMVGRVPWDGIETEWFGLKKKHISLGNWIANKNKKDKNNPKNFKKIVVIDQVKLIDWINDDLDTALWFLTELGHAGRANNLGICSTHERVERYISRFGSIYVAPDILTEGQDELPRILSSLSVPGTVESVYGNSDVEVGATVSHFLNGVSELEGFPIVNIETQAGVELLERIETHHIAILEAEAVNYANRLRRHHTVILAKSLLRDSNPSSRIILRRLSVEIFAKHLTPPSDDKNQGLPSVEYTTIAKAVGRTLPALERLYGNQDKSAPWADPEHTDQNLLKTLAMIGSWNTGEVWVRESNERRDHFKDKALICELCGVQDYTSIQELVSNFSRGEDVPYGAPDPMFSTGPKVVALNAPIDAFYRFAHRFNNDDYMLLESTLTKVLQTRATDTRPREEIYDPALETGYSDDLIGGLILTFVLIGLFGDNESLKLNVNGQPCRSWCERVYQSSLPQLYDHPEFANAIDRWLPLLAEGVPHAFLGSLERLVEGHNETVKEIFRLRDAKYGFGTYHIGASLLWSLERLGWIEEHVDRVCNILLKLHIIAGGDNYNQPMDSLMRILNLGLPMTMAKTPKRIEVIKQLAKNHGQYTLELFAKILDPNRGSIMVPGKPIFTRVTERKITYGEIYDLRDNVVELSLDLSAGSAQNLEKLAESVSLMKPVLFDKFINSIKAIDPKKQDTLALCEALRKVAARHSQYPDADWSMDTERVDKLTHAKQEITPEGIEQFLWLFAGSWIELYDRKRSDSYDTLDEMRVEVIPTIIEAGDESIFGFVNSAGSAFTVGYTIGKYLADVNQGVDKIRKSSKLLNSEKSLEFSRGLSGGLSEVVPEEWLQAIVALPADFEEDLRRKIGSGLVASNEIISGMIQENANPDVKYGFWSSFNIYRLFHVEIKDEIVEAIIDVGRVHDLAVLARNKDVKLSDEVLAKIARSYLPSLAEAISQGRANVNNSMYAFWELLDVVEDREIIDIEERAQIEFPLSHLFRFNGPKGTPAVHRLLAKKPEEFVDILKLLYKPRATEDEANDRELMLEGSDVPSHMADAAYHTLSTMNWLPGQKGDDINYEELESWCNAVIKQSKAINREEVAWSNIGELLAKSPMDPSDNMWPHISIRKFIEENKNERFYEGIRISNFNNRGTIMGSSEAYYTSSAEKYEKMAKSMREWPNTREILKKIAASDRHDAKRDFERSLDNAARSGIN